MKKLLFASIGITVVLMVCTLDDFLSLHDIKADYVSKSVLRHLQVETSKSLPTWTDTPLEWTSVTISYAVRMVLIVSNLAILLLLTRRLPRASGLASVEP
jgi:hypothetical protein